MKRILRGISVAGVIGTFLILIQGALVTKTGSGQGCGNTWPFCHGEVFPSYHTLELWIEYSHRIVSAAVGLIVVITSAWAWRVYRQNSTVKFLAFFSVFFIVLQGLLGAAAVVWGSNDAVMALHFGFSLLSFASIALLSVLLFQLGKENQPHIQRRLDVSQRLKWGLYGLAVYTYIVVYTGAYVRHTGSSLGCSTWPLCNGVWFPDLTTQAGIQLTHRLFAAMLLVFTVWLFVVVRRHYTGHADLVKAAQLCLGLTLLQVISGGLVVLSQLQLVIALLHTTLIALYFAALCYLCLQVGLPWKSDWDEDSSMSAKTGKSTTP
ncbi:COX15/CtaA family protein [Desmospora profundinema]|uniref:Heme A synthase n=1 Tax=Desmospora profundinema TaxID=1571184 RepID=A0ABU1IIG9_9BACL|nr:heme A synthase [Desmospora profundinema]MDR6224563.1 cytochrome c oxidase assembly protein subunit 15 [Desmospora profundinema]